MNQALRNLPRVDEAAKLIQKLLQSYNLELGGEFFDISLPLITDVFRTQIAQYRKKLLQEGTKQASSDIQPDSQPVQLECQQLKEFLDLQARKLYLKKATNSERYEILKRKISCQLPELIQSYPELFYRSLVSYFKLMHCNLQRVINASGVALHTNLGRAPLSVEAQEALMDVAQSYCTIEFDLESGGRGHRLDHIEELLCYLTGAEAACVVNNNAAAVILVLNCFAQGKEALISRGELVEIGGSFRIPDIMKLSGAHMKEVGTTNKTHYQDYEGACGENTALILKVHPSNYQIQGFTESVSCKQLKELATQKGVLLYEDQGSGVLVNLEDFGLPHERSVPEALAEGLDLVSCSGDKLLGSTQAGIIFGKKDLVDKLKRHPLMRALRMDKLCLSALEASLKLYLSHSKLTERLPLLQMLSSSKELLRLRAERLIQLMHEISDTELAELCDYQISTTKSLVGGGSLCGLELESVSLQLKTKTRMSPQRLQELFLTQSPLPIVMRSAQDMVVLDLRTIRGEDELYELAQMLVYQLKRIAQSSCGKED